MMYFSPPSPGDHWAKSMKSVSVVFFFFNFCFPDLYMTFMYMYTYNHVYILYIYIYIIYLERERERYIYIDIKFKKHEKAVLFQHDPNSFNMLFFTFLSGKNLSNTLLGFMWFSMGRVKT